MKLLLSEEIRNRGMITAKARRTYFPKLTQDEIRDMLGRLGLDKQVAIEYLAVELAIMTPKGVIMRVSPEDDGRIALWTDNLKDGETPREGAIRMLKEQTGIVITDKSLQFVDTEYYRHEFANGDKVFLNAFRYAIYFDEVPKLVNPKFHPVLIKHTFRANQEDFVDKLLYEKK